MLIASGLFPAGLARCTGVNKLWRTRAASQDPVLPLTSAGCGSLCSLLLFTPGAGTVIKPIKVPFSEALIPRVTESRTFGYD